jgi:hypothetical protein
MTIQGDLKQHIRTRRAKTGESYTTARAHVLRAREPADECCQRRVFDPFIVLELTHPRQFY